MNVSMVKCIYIDSRNKSVTARMVRPAEGEDAWIRFPGFQKSRMIDFEPGKASPLEEDKIRHVLYYKEGFPQSAKEIPRTGFFWRDPKDWSGGSFDVTTEDCTALVGNALVASYRAEKGLRKMTPIDTTLTLEEVSRGVAEWNDGIYAKVPRFTCMLNKAFAETGYELLLRMENEAEMYGLHPAYILTKPIRMLSPQIISFAFNYDEVIIVTGHIGSPGQKVRCEIFDSNRPDLRCIAAATLAAERLPHWVQDRLRNHFFEQLIAKPFNRRLESRTRSRSQSVALNR